MKKLFCIFMLAILACTLCMLTACSTETTPPEPKEYTIQYTDDNGLHSFNVLSGALYALETIPSRNGYDFLGLYDAKSGGTQYIDETGSALAPFSDNQNLVLFPQFKAKEYTLIFDYQGAEITGTRSLKVSYDSFLNELPLNLSIEHKIFEGWFTEPQGKGLQISDKQGVLPANNKINEDRFDLTNKDGNIFLYAYFTTEKLTVTFYSEDNNNPEEIAVDYGTDIKNVVPTARVNGNAVLLWSKMKNDANKEYIFDGKITDNLILYAAEYAPVIELDENGGDEMVPIVARADSAITLPVPTRENFKFIHWVDDEGEIYEATVMPPESTRIKAIWQAKLVFDENGGSDVLDISKPAGEKIELPQPTKEGFIFAGWYTSDKEKYTATAMPTTGIALKAGWYETKKERIVLIQDSTNKDDWAYTYFYSTEKVGTTKGPKADWRKILDLSEKIPENGAPITIDIHWDMKSSRSSLYFEGGMYFYDGAVVSEANYLTKSIHTVDRDAWKTFTYSGNLNLRSNTLYLSYFAKKTSAAGDGYLHFKNMWADITYPDTTELYL